MFPDAAVLPHLTNVNNGIDGLTWWFDQAVDRGVPFDMIGLSFYGYWHGSFADLQGAVSTLTSVDDWFRAGTEVVADAFDDGLDYIEFRYSPGFISSETGPAREAVIDAVTAGVTDGSRRAGLPVGLIGIIVRDLGPDSAQDQLDAILSRQNTFCGMDLAGNEAGYPAEMFAPAFARARGVGLRLTAHAGEAAGPESVWAAVRHLGVERIGHGVRAAEDPRLMEHLAQAGITLDLALTSNVQTGAAPSYAEHQIHTLLAAGVPVTLNTDDPRVSNVTLSQEHDLARSHVGLSADQLAAVARRSAEAAFTDR